MALSAEALEVYSISEGRTVGSLTVNLQLQCTATAAHSSAQPVLLDPLPALQDINLATAAKMEPARALTPQSAKQQAADAPPAPAQAPAAPELEHAAAVGPVCISIERINGLQPTAAEDVGSPAGCYLRCSLPGLTGW